MRLSCFALLFAVTLVKASHYRNIPHKIKESIEGPPHGWVKHGPAPSDHPLELKIALPQPYFPILEQHLWEVSDPNHERYGAYLSKEETEALMSPHPETLDAVNEWLLSYDIEEEDIYRSSAQDWLTIRVSVALAEEILDTKYHVYTHLDSGESIVRTTSYSLPEGLHDHVELVQPTTMFTRLKPFKSTLHWSNTPSSSPSTGTITGPAGNQVDASCNNTITITCLRQLYNAVGYKTSATNGNKIAVTAYTEQYANNKDLQQFYQLENPEAYGSNYTFASVNGGLNNQSYEAAGVEANLDVQFAFGLTYPTPATFYSTGGSPPYIPDDVTPTNTNEPYANWLDYVLFQKHLPQTISTSYGDSEQTVPFTYATRVCAGFVALGVRGVSLLFSSGDGGVGDGRTDPATQQCFANHGTNRTVFLPQFPASCPYEYNQFIGLYGAPRPALDVRSVTAVGGTNDIPEIAADLSGGGFSNYFPRPHYQKAAVSNYLEKLAPGTYKGLYNPHGRGIPDVSAQALNFQIVYQGHTSKVAGTSCAAPTFASFVSMLNDARINAGKPPLGFLNPWLYKKGYTGLNDITVGNNPGCGTDGFNATIGWDPVTGLGTPDFETLLALALGNRYVADLAGKIVWNENHYWF